jgi:hypothetical protein
MKKITLLLFIIFIQYSCSKDKKLLDYSIRYTIVGDGIENITCNINNANYSVKGDFKKGWDTTFSTSQKQLLQVIAKSKCGSLPRLIGLMYLNNKEVKRVADESKDSLGYYDFNIEYQIP